jgi:pimeloyl-ACP methyl ester carboxylesterase
MQIIVDTQLTHYERHGRGSVVLLLHGWGDSALGLRTLHKHLALSYDVVALSLPGFGGSVAPEGAWGLDEYGQFTKAFLQKLDLEPYAVIGHSNGGAILIRALAKHWLHPQKLILLSSAGIRNQDESRKRTLKLIAKGGKVLSSPLPARTKSSLRNKLYKSVGSDMLVAPGLEETFKRVVSEDIQADATEITVPTLLIYGDADTQTPVSYGKLLHAAIASSKLVILPETGHFVHIETLDLVMKVILEFLE